MAALAQDRAIQLRVGPPVPLPVASRNPWLVDPHSPADGLVSIALDRLAICLATTS